MTEQAPLHERLDEIAERARAELRNPELKTLFVDLTVILREIAETKAETTPGTGLTPEQLTQAIGGAAFLSSLGAMLDKIDRARAEDVERVLHHLFAARTPAPPNGPAPGRP